MKIEILCPLYNAEKYITDLHASLLKQKADFDVSIRYLLTESTDQTKDLLDKLDCVYELVKKSEFSHSLTRERAAFSSSADIIVFVTQDVVIEKEDWLSFLVDPIITGEVSATFSRQISNHDAIEKYTRELNYPRESYVMDKSKLSACGLRTFFYSDAASAMDLKVFKELNGYDQKDFPSSEDMYIAYKLIQAGYKLKYCADSVVLHSHDFTFKELYDRYYLNGQFFKQNPEIMTHGVTESGAEMAMYILKRIIQDRNSTALIQFIPNMVARYFGMKFGSISKN